MANILYHYVHCPYCLRVRMAAGYLNTEYRSVVLDYDDEKTPISLVGKKICPIWVDDFGKAMPESLDIILKIDLEDKLKSKLCLRSEKFEEFQKLLNLIGQPVHNLAMPHWIYTKEFSETSRNYFQKKKEEKRGPFKNLVKNRLQFENEIHSILNNLEKSIDPFYIFNSNSLNGQNITLADIMLASHLWGLYVVPEFQFSEKIHNYLQTIKKLCFFNYQEDFWK